MRLCANIYLRMAKLFMTLVGCTPSNRNIEQHDVFFGIGNSILNIIPDVKAFWPEGNTKIHFDAWREVNKVGEYQIKVIEEPAVTSSTQLFFINLGGYKPKEFEEFHYKMILAAPHKGEAITQAKQTAFFRHTGFEGANSHIDDKYGVDVDDIFEIRDILPASYKSRYGLQIEPAPPGMGEDHIHIGYFRLDRADKWANV